MHNCFSFFSPDSEIYKINQNAGIHPVAVSEDTFYLLSLALEYAKETKGKFDVTVGSISKLWKNAIRSGTLPTEEKIKY